MKNQGAGKVKNKRESGRPKGGPRHDWPAMEAEYVNSLNGSVSTSSLAKKYGVSQRRVELNCSRGKWVDKRNAAIGEASEIRRKQSIDARVAYLKDMAETCVGISNLVRARFSGIHRAYAQAKVELDKGDPEPMMEWLARKDVQDLDVAALDKVARLENYLRGEPDQRIEMTDADKQIAAAYWKARWEQMKKAGEEDKGSKPDGD